MPGQPDRAARRRGLRDAAREPRRRRCARCPQRQGRSASASCLRAGRARTRVQRRFDGDGIAFYGWVNDSTQFGDDRGVERHGDFHLRRPSTHHGTWNYRGPRGDVLRRPGVTSVRVPADPWTDPDPQPGTSMRTFASSTIDTSIGCPGTWRRGSGSFRANKLARTRGASLEGTAGCRAIPSLRRDPRPEHRTSRRVPKRAVGRRVRRNCDKSAQQSRVFVTAPCGGPDPSDLAD